MIDYDRLWRKLLLKRMYKNMSQITLSLESGVSQQLISKYETGHLHDIRLGTLEKLASALDMTLVDLITLIENP